MKHFWLACLSYDESRRVLREALIKGCLAFVEMETPQNKRREKYHETVAIHKLSIQSFWMFCFYTLWNVWICCRCCEIFKSRQFLLIYVHMSIFLDHYSISTRSLSFSHSHAIISHSYKFLSSLSFTCFIFSLERFTCVTVKKILKHGKRDAMHKHPRNYHKFQVFHANHFPVLL